MDVHEGPAGAREKSRFVFRIGCVSPVPAGDREHADA
jgi:hypothetical protein